MEAIYTEKPADRQRNRPLKDYSSVRFGRLVGVSLVERDVTRNNNHKWLFHCDCGQAKVFSIQTVRSGNASSCGCLARDVLVARNTTHGLTKIAPLEYRTWKDMRARCSNPNNKDHKDYGLRGIVIDPRWHDFAVFYADMGSKPTPKHTLDRIDVNGDYEPSNCRWADIETQANNKRCTPKYLLNGKEQTITQWAREYAVERKTVYYRLKQGWSLIDSLTLTDLRKRKSPEEGIAS